MNCIILLTSVQDLEDLASELNTVYLLNFDLFFPFWNFKLVFNKLFRCRYVLWKKGWRAKGYGFTLKGDCDFKLADFTAGTPESFDTHYGRLEYNFFVPLYK